MSGIQNVPQVAGRTSALLLALAGAALLTPLVAACGPVSGSAAPTSQASTANAGDTDSSAPAPAGAGPSGSGAAGGGAAAPATRVADCTTGGVAVKVAMKQQAEFTGTIQGTLTLTNTTKNTCRLTGWVGVTLVNPADEPVQVPTEKVNKPTAPIVVDLAPGAVAAAGLKWAYCDKGDEDCPAGNSLSVSLPADSHTAYAELSGFPAPESVGITMRSLQIGTLQPSGANVLGW